MSKRFETGLAGQLDRRQMLKLSGLTTAGLAGSVLLAACGGDDEEPTATSTAGQATATMADGEPTVFGTAGEATATEATGAATATEVMEEPTETADAEVTEIYGFPIEPALNDSGTLVWGVAYTDHGNYLGGNTPPEVFEGLTELHPQTGEPMPCLAEGWEVSDDIRFWTFTLRQGVTFHNGDPLIAEDVVYTIALLNVYWGGFFADATTEAPDEMTVTFAFERPTVYTANELFYYGIHSATVLSDLALDAEYEEIASHPANTGDDASLVVGTGPFQLVESVAGSHETLARYEGYWAGRPHLDQIIKQIIALDLLVLNLLTGEIDLAGARGVFVDPAQVGDLAGAEDIDVIDFQGDLYYPFWTNQFEDVTTMFLDVRVRQAMLYAIDREAIAEALTFGYGEVPNVTMNLPWAYDPDGITVEYSYDPELAGQLLEEAGWVMGADGIREKDGQKFAIRGYSWSGGGSGQGAVVIQDYWREVGISVELADEEWPTFSVRMEQSHDFDVIFHPLGFVGIDQSILWSCEGNSLAADLIGYCDEELDALLAAQSSESDPDVRREITTEILNYVMETLPVAPVYAPRSIAAKRNTLHNIHPNRYNFNFNIETWWING
jgi:peptide/nickel transport system substrate-binding protein